MMDQLLDADLAAKITAKNAIRLIPPAGFLDIISLEKNARLIITDSGGLQKEAFFFQKPCVILRPETEWVEIVQNGNAILADADEKRIINAVSELLGRKDFSYPSIFGDGNAAKFIAEKMLEQIVKQ
jgi:UDP-GlcNAc3NAcA epimerase